LHAEAISAALSGKSREARPGIHQEAVRDTVRRRELDEVLQADYNQHDQPVVVTGNAMSKLSHAVREVRHE